MKNQLNLFFTAIMFYTRIPVPKKIGYSDENLNKATRYFPLVGGIVGGLGIMACWICLHWLSPQVSILISMIVTIYITGAFHEDGFADFCDGFGGGCSKEQILTIMKDSRLGTYGTIGLITILLLKFYLLTSLNEMDILLVIFVSHVISRVNPVVLIFSSTYVNDTNKSKSKPIGKKSGFSTLIVALVLGLLPLYFLPLKSILFVLLFLLFIFFVFRRYVHKKLGGYTGDVLGALQQISEIGIIFSFIMSQQIL